MAEVKNYNKPVIPDDCPYWEASRLRVEGRLHEAFALLKGAVVRHPQRPWLFGLLGETLRGLGSRLRGYAEIQAAARLDPACAFAGALLREAAKPELAWALALRGGALRAEGRLEEAEKVLAEAVELDAGCGWAWGWLGEARLRLGRLEEARSALGRSIALFAEWSQAYAWRGEALRQLGLCEEALRDLDYSIALGLRQADVLVSRSAVREALGDARGRERDLVAAVRLAPEAAAGAPELRGLVKTLKRSSELAARGRLDEALKADPGNGEALAARSREREARGRLNEALEDADAAVKADASAASYARRAEVAQKLGLMEAALRDLSLSLALSPSVALYRWRAQTFLGMRHYDLALQDLSTALELEPDSPELYDLRSQVNLVLGRLLPAQEDLEKALLVLPGHVNLHLRRGQLLALQGRFGEARASVDPIRKSSPAWAAFIEGYVACVEKRYEAAMKSFGSASRLAGENDAYLKRQSDFYGTVARAFAGLNKEETMAKLQAAKKQAEAKGKVYLCGLGVYPPQTATVEVLRGISECDVVFNNLPGMGISEFLGLFCANRRPVAFRYEQDAKLCADLVLSEVRAGRTVGFITFGHPLLFGPLSHEIIKRCNAEKIPCKAFGAVSSMDAVLAASGQVLGYSYGGFQLFETTGTGILDEIASANTRLPLVVYFADGMGEQWLASLVKTLGKKYGQGHRVLLYGPRHELWETQQDKITVKDLGALSHHKLAQGILFVPPR